MASSTTPEAPRGSLTDEEREQYEYLIEEYPELESADLARRVLDYYEEES